MNYRDLKVWQESKSLVILVYQLTASFPSDEKFGLISQIRRAVVSIPSNIAEGNTSSYLKERIKFFGIARSSLAELMTQMEISNELDFLEDNELNIFEERATHVGKMLTNLINSCS